MAMPNLTVQRWRRRKSECFWEHTCFERYTAIKVATFLRAAQKQGGYFIRIKPRRRSLRRTRRPEYYWVVRAYRKIDRETAVDIDDGNE